MDQVNKSVPKKICSVHLHVSVFRANKNSKYRLIFYSSEFVNSAFEFDYLVRADWQDKVHKNDRNMSGQGHILRSRAHFGKR